MKYDLLTRVLAIALYTVAWVIAFLRPPLGVAMALLGLWFVSPFPQPGEAPWALYGYFGLAAAPVISWVLRQPFAARQRRRGAHPLTQTASKSIGIFLAVCLASFPLSLMYNRGLGMLDRLYYYARGLLPFLYLMMFFVVRDLAVKQQGLGRLGKLMFAVCAIFACEAYWVYFTTHQRITYMDPNFIMPYTTLAAVCACAYLLFSWRTTAAGFWAIASVLLTGSVVLGFTKAQAIALAGGVLVVSGVALAQRSKRRIVWAATAILVVGAVAWRGVGFRRGSPIASIWEERLEDASSFEARSAEIHIAMQNFLAEPVLGKGLGYRYRMPYYFKERNRIEYMHNAGAYLLMTLGAVGLGAYLWIFVVWGRALLQAFHYQPHRTETILVALHGAVFSLLVYSFMFASFRIVQVNVVLATCLGLIFRLQEEKGDGDQALVALGAFDQHRGGVGNGPASPPRAVPDCRQSP